MPADNGLLYNQVIIDEKNKAVFVLVCEQCVDGGRQWLRGAEVFSFGDGKELPKCVSECEKLFKNGYVRKDQDDSYALQIDFNEDSLQIEEYFQLRRNIMLE